jgi:TonB-dependent receptor
MKLFYSIFLFLFFSASFAQLSTLKGVVIEEKTGLPVPGAIVNLKSLSKNLITGADGVFVFTKLESGTYELLIQASGFNDKEVVEIVLLANDINSLTITLDEKSNEIEQVVIKSTKAKVESVKGLLTLQKNSTTVSDGISSEAIKRTPDRNTSDVLKRINGASVQDNRFVIVRGLNDRYNMSLLNGAPLPSSEPDRKAFSFDIFPSNMLDNIVITKTASPDLPGDFAGGIIQISSKSVPDKDFQSLTVGSGYNTITTFKNKRSYAGSATDWLGFDNGQRALPSSIPNTEAFNQLSYIDKANVAKSFEVDWKIYNETFRPNTNFQYTIGRSFDISQKRFGLLFAVSNSISNNYNEIERNEFDNGNNISVLRSKYNDRNYSQDVLTSALANFSLKFNPNHTITFKNTYSINSEDLVIEREGKAEVDNTNVLRSDVRWFTSNKIYSGQFNGDHFFTTSNIKLNWTGFFSNIERSIPNLRRNEYRITDPNSPILSENTPVVNLPSSNNGGPDYGGGMFTSENQEVIYGGKLDISRKFSFGDFVNDIKVGGLLQKRDRDFFARQLNYNKFELGTNIFDSSLELLPNESIFSSSNMGITSPGKTGFTLYDLAKPTDIYNAGSNLNAAYLMFDNRYKKFRLVWGLRVEDFTQYLNTKDGAGRNINSNTNVVDFLPSANFIYSITSKANLRLSYSKTLNRPEFRELAPFGFYDNTTQFFTQGNPNLERATIKNFDIRYDLYPGKGQLFSISYFVKQFTNPIEIIQQVNNKTITYQNAKSAKNAGIEIEFRTLLSSLFGLSESSVLEKFTLFSNAAIINSAVDVSNVNDGNKEKERPLQGQSPYIFNAGLQFSDKESGFIFSTNVNRVGNRIAIGSSQVEPAIWEKSRTFLDLQIAKAFYNNKIELKLNVQNILAQDLIFYQNNYQENANQQSSNNGIEISSFGGSSSQDFYDSKVDDALWTTKFGRNFSFSFIYNF